MKKNLILFIFLIIFISSCYVLPVKLPRLENMTISIPFGDTTVTIVQAIADQPERFRTAGDTVYAKTKTVTWRNYSGKDGTKDSLRIHINIEELLNEDVIDIDSTVFNSTVDKIVNYITLYGHFPNTATAEFRHYIYNRFGDTIYVDTIERTILADTLNNVGVDSIRPFTFEINDFPVGDYEHDIDIVFDTTIVSSEIDSAIGYSETAIMFHLNGDTIITLWQDQELFSPPDSTPIELLNRVEINIDINNRIPLGEKLILLIHDSLDNPIFADTLDIAIPPVDASGITTGDPAFTHLNIVIDTTIYNLFNYETGKGKVKLELPIPEATSAVHVRPDDYIRVNGNIIVNFEFDNDELGEEYKVEY